MNTTKKLICALAAGAALAAAAPVFADQGREREHDAYRGQRSYSNYDRPEYRGGFRGYDRPAYRGSFAGYDRHEYRRRFRDFDRRYPLVVQRPMIVERPMYYAQPAPIAYGIGPGAIIGAAIGSYIDYNR